MSLLLLSLGFKFVMFLQSLLIGGEGGGGRQGGIYGGGEGEEEKDCGKGGGEGWGVGVIGAEGEKENKRDGEIVSSAVRGGDGEGGKGVSSSVSIVNKCLFRHSNIINVLV